MVSDPSPRSFTGVLDLAVHQVSTRAAGRAGDLEEALFLLGMVPVVEARPVAAFGGGPEQVFNRIGAALAAAPEWPAAGPPGVTWPPPVDGLPDSLDAALARQPPSAAAWGLAAGLLGTGNCRALLRRAADAVRPLDTARWTARQRIAAAAVILAGLGAIVPTADPATGTMKYYDLGQALPVILALAALTVDSLGVSFLDL